MTGDSLAVDRHERSGAVVVRLSGVIDLSNARELEARVLERGDGTGPLVLDLSELDYLDSSGLAMIDRLAGALAARNRPLRLIAPEGSVAHGVLRIAQLAGVPLTSPAELESDDALEA